MLLRRRNQYNNHRGFTLLELLAVLSIASLLLAISIPLSNHLQMKHEEKLFLKQFQADILFIQQQTMTTGIRHSLTFVNDHTYKLYTYQQGQEIIGEVVLPSHMTVQTLTSSSTIQFNEKGTVLRPGTLYFHSPNTTYKAVFTIGKGRCYVTKL
ncbi:hypothetical protein N784_00525 [Pontibacillus litoralis JSM 072002]|uniref:Competence protein ComG n=1 Tax=Pontibacillus litoralis JSM 072002 TaxID=1385512 RepID=A0A0A5GD97_9BACI|nr:hypothetical protein N784_00525 [Pontibacillus litoralis JSM 072002]